MQDTFRPAHSVKYEWKPSDGLGYTFRKPFQMCNRFDQALYSILMFNYFNYDDTIFHLSPGDQIARPSRTGVRISPGSSGDVAMKAIAAIEKTLASS